MEEEPTVAASNSSEQSKNSSLVSSSVSSVISSSKQEISSKIVSSTIVNETKLESKDGIHYDVPQKQSGFKSWMPYTDIMIFCTTLYIGSSLSSTI